MKKSLLTIVSLILALLTFTGCSCTPTIAYSFTSYWQKDKVYSSTYHEKAVYTVTHVTDFSEKIDNKNTGSVTYDFKAEENAYYDYSFGVGDYTVEVQAVSSLPAELGGAQGNYYYLTTKLNIPVTFTEKAGENKPYTSDDKIISQVYFSDVQNSLHPVWSKKSYVSTTVRTDNSGAGKVVKYAYTTEITWNNGKAKFTLTDDSATLTDTFDDNFKKITLSNKQKEIGYTKYNALDNESLLFAIRGLTLSDSYNNSFKIIDTAYESVQSVSVTGRKVTNLNDLSYNLMLNGVDSVKTGSSTCLVTVGRNDSTYSGSPTICYYQLMKYTGNDENITTESESRACLMKMVTKLGTFGALVYNISELTITD